MSRGKSKIGKATRERIVSKEHLTVGERAGLKAWLDGINFINDCSKSRGRFFYGSDMVLPVCIRWPDSGSSLYLIRGDIEVGKAEALGSMIRNSLGFKSDDAVRVISLSKFKRLMEILRS